jgi:hypothetical protein
MDQNVMQASNSSVDKLQLTKSELLGEQKQASEPSSLWQAAYDNPIKAGLCGAAAVAGGAALIYASKGRIAERLLGSKADVLVIEDTPAMGKAFSEVLASKGHNVTWVTSVKSLKPLIGITPDGAEIGLSRRFRLALVDGDLGKGVLTGPEIVGTLKSNRIMSIGTSSVDTFNTDMLKNGADIAANKAVILAGLMGDKLELKAALKAPAVAQEGLKSFAGVMRTPEFAPLRKQADELLMKHFAS